jgi:hypothetical protein
VAQGLGERPLAVDPLVPHGLGQPLGARDALRPAALDGVPHRAVLVRRPHPAQLPPLGIPPVEFGGHEAGDVDVVDDDPAAVARHPETSHL